MAIDIDHSFLIGILSEDGEVLLEDTDFSEDARFDWFEENHRQAAAGDVFELIDSSDGRVISEDAPLGNQLSSQGASRSQVSGARRFAAVVSRI